MAASFTTAVSFTGDPAEETDGIEVAIDTQPTNDYLVFASAETEGDFVTFRIPLSQKTIASFTIYPSGAFVGDVNILVIPQT